MGTSCAALHALLLVSTMSWTRLSASPAVALAALGSPNEKPATHTMSMKLPPPPHRSLRTAGNLVAMGACNRVTFSNFQRSELNAEYTEHSQTLVDGQPVFWNADQTYFLCAARPPLPHASSPPVEASPAALRTPAKSYDAVESHSLWSWLECAICASRQGRLR